MLLTRTQIRRLVYAHGREILEHDHMAIERVCYQHGVVTTFAHSIRVACLTVWIADRLHLWHRVDLHSLIRAALLHDYFLYDWHAHDGGRHRMHGFTHGGTAMRNAIEIRMLLPNFQLQPHLPTSQQRLDLVGHIICAIT